MGTESEVFLKLIEVLGYLPVVVVVGWAVGMVIFSYPCTQYVLATYRGVPEVFIVEHEVYLKIGLAVFFWPIGFSLWFFWKLGQEVAGWYSRNK